MKWSAAQHGYYFRARLIGTAPRYPVLSPTALFPLR